MSPMVRCKLLPQINIPSRKGIKKEHGRSPATNVHNELWSNSQTLRREGRSGGSARRVLSEIYARQFGFFFLFFVLFFFYCFSSSSVCRRRRRRRHTVLNAFQLISQILFRSCCGRSACKPCVGGGCEGLAKGGLPVHLHAICLVASRGDKKPQNVIVAHSTLKQNWFL